MSTETEAAEAAATDARVMRWVKFSLKALAGSVLFIVAVSLAVGIIQPRINLHKANTEKKAVIAEQKAKSEAAEFAATSKVTQAEAKGKARVIDAKALAKSQAIINATLTPEYLRYLYIESISDNENQIIYVPTESGLPITEAGRADPNDTSVTVENNTGD